jgi:hypothetical protein
MVKYTSYQILISHLRAPAYREDLTVREITIETKKSIREKENNNNILLYIYYFDYLNARSNPLPTWKVPN